MKTYTLILATALALTACGGKPETAPTANNATASVAAEPVASAVPNNTEASTSMAVPSITSTDGIFLFVPDASFADKTSESSLHPDSLASEQITLLQYDENRNLTLTAVQYGKANGDSKAVFTQLTNQLKQDKSLSNVQVGDATANQLSYQFERKDKNSTTAESCIAYVSAEQQVSNICASSDALSAADLTQFLSQTVQVKN